MIVVESLEKNTGKPLVLTIGTFDGAHLGHKCILDKIKEIALTRNFETALLSFQIHPRFVLKNDATKLRLINSIPEKIELLAKHALDRLYLIPFTEELSNTTAEDFVRNLVSKLNIKVFCIGYDHRFGKDRVGDIHLLKAMSTELDFEVLEIEKQEVSDITISSTKIRNYLNESKIEEANSLLGYPYFIKGKVVHGQKSHGQHQGNGDAHHQTGTHVDVPALVDWVVAGTAMKPQGNKADGQHNHHRFD